MASILLENLPDTIHRTLKERAKANHRTLDAEVLACLEIALRPANSAERKPDQMPITLSNDSLWDACHSIPG
ncbi:MAG: hypothetical protein WAM53_17505 [Terrimicrobiaceae bacterium]